MKDSLNQRQINLIQKQESLHPQNPLLKLIKCQGFSGKDCPDIHFTP